MSVMGKKCWAVCCGAVRVEYELYSTLAILCEYRSRGLLEGIVISTWKGEIDRIKGLREKLASLGVHLIESEPLHEDMGRYLNLNFARQAYQLNKGLDLIPNDVFVLRCRTDYSISKIDLCRSVLMGEVDLTVGNHGCLNFGLQYRIGVMRFAASDVFFNVDSGFIGYKSDIYKMVRFNMNEFISDCKFKHPDRLFYYNLFWDRFPVFEELLRICNKDYYLENEYVNDAMIEYARESKKDFYLPRIYNLLYAMYYCILRNCFVLLHPVKNDKIDSVQLYEIFSMDNKNIGVYKDGPPCFGNLECLRKLIDGEYVDSNGYRKLLKEIKNLMLPNYIKECSIKDVDVEELRWWLKNSLQINKELIISENNWHIKKQDAIDVNGVKALEILTDKYILAKDSRYEIYYNIIRCGFLGQYFRSYDYTEANLECVRKADSSLYYSALQMASRKTSSYILYNIANLIYKSNEERCNEIGSVFKKYSYLNSFCNFPFSAMRLSAFYLWEKYVTLHGGVSYAERIINKLIQMYQPSTEAQNEIRRLPKGEARLLAMIKEIVSEKYHTYQNDAGIRTLIEFLADQFGKQGISQEIYRKLTEFIVLRCFDYPFSIGEDNALDNLLKASIEADNEKEAETFSYLLLRERFDSDAEIQQRIDATIASLVERFDLKTDWLAAHYASNNSDINFANVHDIKSYTLICRILSSKRMLSSHSLKTEHDLESNLEKLIFDFFILMENESDIVFFTLKNNSEIWFHSAKCLHHEYNSKFILSRDGEGKLWPQSSRPARSPFAAFFRLENNKTLLMSVEFCCPISLAKDRFFMALDSTHMDKFNPDDKNIRLLRKNYPIDNLDDFTNVLTRAMRDFKEIEYYVLLAFDQAAQEKYDEETLERMFDKYYGKEMIGVDKKILKWLEMARIDIKNQGADGNDLKIKVIANERYSLSNPKWFSKSGKGYVLETDVKNLLLELECVGEGDLMIRLQGIDRRSYEDERLPLWVDYTRLAVDEEVIFMDVKFCWHDKGYIFTSHVTHGQKIKVDISWLPHRYESKELYALMSMWKFYA